MEEFPKGWLLLYSQKYEFGVPSNTVKFPFKVTSSGAEKHQKFFWLLFKAEAVQYWKRQQKKAKKTTRLLLIILSESKMKPLYSFGAHHQKQSQ